jgi:hypothetical protein
MDINHDSATDEAIPEVHREDHGFSDDENPELGFDDLEDDWIDEDSEGEMESEVEEEEELILAMDDMYYGSRSQA